MVSYFKIDSAFKNDFKTNEKKPPLIKHLVLDNKVNVYRSTKDGLRFDFSQIDFNQDIQTESSWFNRETSAILTIDLNKTKQVNSIKLDLINNSY